MTAAAQLEEKMRAAGIAGTAHVGQEVSVTVVIESDAEGKAAAELVAQVSRCAEELGLQPIRVRLA
jgi:hypothetical protein